MGRGAGVAAPPPAGSAPYLVQSTEDTDREFGCGGRHAEFGSAAHVVEEWLFHLCPQLRLCGEELVE
jgi:hypothetical protein